MNLRSQTLFMFFLALGFNHAVFALENTPEKEQKAILPYGLSLSGGVVPSPREPVSGRARARSGRPRVRGWGSEGR